ncbi:hypothetical protein [Ideonella sp.]|uniref:hypothetical protein n=1 Tax=Ideonella sp. TaxID=1929293 RepID=UPI003BB57C8D
MPRGFVRGLAVCGLPAWLLSVQAQTIAERTAAVRDVVQGDAACTSLTPFFWEIGDASGAKASGNGGAGAGKLLTAASTLPIASASKWVFASLLVEQAQGQLSELMVRQLNLTSGYTNFKACAQNTTVGACLSQVGAAGGTNGDYRPAHDGKFYYNSGHMQLLGNASGYGGYNNSTLTTALKQLPNTQRGLTYVNPQLAGGMGVSVNGYGLFLRNMLSGTYTHMAPLLGSHAVCTTPNSVNCPTAVFSPINNTREGGPNAISNEEWHYSLGHWVEDDPVVGDGAFSSPGRSGFYPWIDASKTWYGIIARNDTVNLANPDPKLQPYYTSIQCGRKMRAAWITPTTTGAK